MESIKLLILIFLPILIFLFFSGRNPELEKVSMNLSGEKFTIEVADTWLTRMRGLQNRTSIGKHEGMLFVFSKEGQPSFWMKDVNFPLDIIFLDKNKILVEVFESLEPCNSSVCPSYKTSVPFKYALELPAGTVKRLDLNLGMQFK
ncbi:MAG: DUF192 domain-containing protein [Candidatus Altiarchaeota archaeon]|nr:DUF192 domain-containing protein [Candidatus Altiarchaeota archaeon]